MNTHTPTPWICEPDGPEQLYVYAANGDKVATLNKEADIPFVLTACNAHAALTERHKDNYGMVQEALRFLSEGEFESVKCLLDHINLNSKTALALADGKERTT